MIEISHLTKQFGPLKAVDDISLSISAGEVLGFLGPNGAGKSTTMKMITGFLTPTSGAIDVCGHAVAGDPIAVKRRIGSWLCRPALNFDQHVGRRQPIDD